MKNWSRRERGLAGALVLAVAAAIAVPAWAGESDQTSGEPASVEFADGAGAGVAVVGVPAPDALADCLRRHGVSLPAVRPGGDELKLAISRPDDQDAMRRAAEACGIPKPPTASAKLAFAGEAAVKPDGLGDCLRRHGANLPAVRPEGNELPAPIPRPDFDETFRRAAEACGLPEPPPGHDPFPLTDEQIDAQRAELADFVNCMRDHGQELDEPEVDRNRIKIQLPPDAFSEQFLDAQRACGGPPVGP